MRQKRRRMVRRPVRRAPAPQKRAGGTRQEAELAKGAIEREPICWLRLPGCTIRSDSGDHYHPYKTHPHLRMEPRNWRGACRHCNHARGATPVHELPKLREKMVRSGKYGRVGRPQALGFFDED